MACTDPKSKCRLEPHQARSEATVDSWWYENPNSIEVLVRDRLAGGRTITCRIDRAAIEQWLARTKKRPSGNSL